MKKYIDEFTETELNQIVAKHYFNLDCIKGAEDVLPNYCRDDRAMLALFRVLGDCALIKRGDSFVGRVDNVLVVHTKPGLALTRAAVTVLDLENRLGE